MLLEMLPGSMARSNIAIIELFAIISHISLKIKQKSILSDHLLFIYKKVDAYIAYRWRISIGNVILVHNLSLVKMIRSKF